MFRLLSLQLIIGIIILKLRDIAGNHSELTPAQLCRNPLVTSATKTPFGVICMIPKVQDSDRIEKRQQFVRSLPKLMKAEQNEQLQAKLIPNLKLIRSQFRPQTNILTKRSILSNWFQKFYESLYKTVYKSLKYSFFRNINANSQTEQQQQQQQHNLPQHQYRHIQQQQPVPMPLVNPDQLTAEGQDLTQHFQFDPNSPLLPQQESQIISNYIPVMGQKPLLSQDFPQSMLPLPDMSSEINSGESLPLMSYNNEMVAENDPVIDENRLGAAVHDLPQYNYGSVRQLATYLQSIQERINGEKLKNSDEEREADSSDFVNDYSSITADSSNDKHEFVIPLYTDFKVREKPFMASEGRAEEEVRRPRKLVYEFHGYKKDMDCKGRFKPLKSEAEKEQPLPPMSVSSHFGSKSRRKRYIELDYGQMQLRKLPIWFNRNEENPHSEAIVEVKPRSLFRWEQPMLGWKPLVPPEELRKDLFLKRNGDPLETWDHEQVESQNNYQWLRPELDFNQTTDINRTTELTDAERLTIEAIKNLDLSKSSVVIDRRNYGNNDHNNRNRDYYLAKEQQVYSKAQDIANENKYISSTDQAIDNRVIGSEPQMSPKESDQNRGIKAVEVENVGEDVTKIRSLEEIAALPGAVIKPIDPKLTDILLKVLSHNSDFAQKRITNAYFLEFPKLPNYRPSGKQRPNPNYIVSDEVYSEVPVQTPAQTPVQTPVESIVNPNYDLDIQLTDSDYEWGEIVCSNKVSGAVADIRKGCRIYYQCTPYTIDTYVCPRGSIFDDRKQFCLPPNKVICGTYS